MASKTHRLSIQWASVKDLEWLAKWDPHISKKLMLEKINRREVAIARKGGKPVGLLRYSLFCDWIPFIIFLFILEDQRRQGVGSQLVSFMEKQMRRKRARMVMVSSWSGGSSQHFWRKLGYCDVGCCHLPDEPFELLFAKQL